MDAQRENDLRNEIENYIDKEQGLNAYDFLSAPKIKKLIGRHIKSCGDTYEWAYKPDKKNLLEIWSTRRYHFLRNSAAIFLLLWIFFLFCTKSISLSNKLWINVYIIAFLIFIVISVVAITAYITKTRYTTADRPNDANVRKLSASQLYPVINEMTAAAPLKPGKLRRHFYAIALRIINIGNYRFMNVPTVSSLRWFVIDKKRRLVFLSNYINSTDFYVRDFLNGKSTQRGINFMFSNGVGFPDAKNLVRGGITYEPEGYINAVHFGQQVTDLWYAHQPNLTADIINKNRKIRKSLFRDMTKDEANEWLKLL